MVWARITFLAVMGKKAPAFTVASLAMTMTSRPATRPRPVTTPRAGAPPHSSYMPKAANSPNSRSSVPGSSKRASLSRAVRRFLPCWASMALGPPPWRRVSSCCRRVERSASIPLMLVWALRDCRSSLEGNVFEKLSIGNPQAYHPGECLDLKHTFALAKIPRTCQTFLDYLSVNPDI